MLSYVYDSGLAELDELAAAAIRAVQPVNGLDPTTFTSVAVMEGEVVAFARELLGGSADVVGSVTTGGTESCLLAVKTARDLWTGSGTPRLLAPVTVHAAFQKAAHYFGLDLDLVPVEQDGRVSAEAMAARLGPDVALVVVSAPSYPHAALDPIAEVAAAAAELGIPCHVDACIGGWVLPFWSDLPPWDFRVPGVTSVSADLHKFGYAPKGVSVLLQRGRDRQRAQFFTTTRWPGYPVVNPTMLGSKSAGALAAGWASSRHPASARRARSSSWSARSRGCASLATLSARCLPSPRMPRPPPTAGSTRTTGPTRPGPTAGFCSSSRASRRPTGPRCRTPRTSQCCAHASAASISAVIVARVLPVHTRTRCWRGLISPFAPLIRQA